MTQDPLHEAELLRFVETPASGGVVLFSGVVRNLHEGRAVHSIDYSAAEELASVKLAAICAEVLEAEDVHRVAAVHRLGLLQVGEPSILVAASSAHRDTAFRAARQLIDRVKEVLPVWKREHFDDGETKWSAGTRVPTSVRTGEASP
ncbi:MAG: molybdopterin converting factor [Gemmatimonadetes bacterium]|nr:molybdopterin converting factor [Gemmatimonadota bacterium]